MKKIIKNVMKKKNNYFIHAIQHDKIWTNALQKIAANYPVIRPFL